MNANGTTSDAAAADGRDLSRRRRKLAVYWAASCGGCDIALLGVNEKILDVAEACNVVFWPCVADGKVGDVEKTSGGRLAINSLHHNTQTARTD